VILRHDRIKRTLRNFFAKRFIVREEPSRLLRGNSSRPDLLIEADSGTLAIDVTVALVGGAQRNNLCKAAADKIRKFREPLREKGISFFPFAIGHTGELESATKSFLLERVPDPVERNGLLAQLWSDLLLGNSRIVVSQWAGCFAG
jgi:hypothetical protein